MALIALLIPVTLLSVYAASLSFRAITRLRTYESASETAAKFNQKAADQLWRTRTTQGAAAVAIILSLGSSVFLRVYTDWAALQFVNALASSAAWYHFSPFWHEQVSIPGVSTWNEAVETSNSLRPILLGLAGAWWVVSVVGLVL